MTVKRYNKLTKQQRKLAFEAIDFFVDRVMPRMKNSLNIRIIGDSNLIKKKGMFGFCDYVDVESRYPRDFEITVDTQTTIENFVSTIIHEMVHVKQWARGEMRDLSTGKRRWKNSKIIISNLNYYDHPWEIEAFELEKQLFEEFGVMRMKNGVLVDSLTGNTKKRMKRLNSKKDRSKAKAQTNKSVERVYSNVQP